MSNAKVKIRVKPGCRHSRREGRKRMDYQAGDVFSGTERELTRFADKLERAGNRAAVTKPGGGSRATRPSTGSSGATARSRSQQAEAPADADDADSGDDSGADGDDQQDAGDDQPAGQ